MFAAFQALNHPKVLPIATGIPYPLSSVQGIDKYQNAGGKLGAEDTILTIAVIGLGPVGLVGTLFKVCGHIVKILTETTPQVCLC